MSLSSTILVPELQYYSNNLLMTDTLNKYSVLSPVTISTSYFNQGSFIQLLFDDNWPLSLKTYNYKFKEITQKSSWPNIVLNRLSIYPVSSKYYMCDSTTNADINLFNLEEDDLSMINKLIEYRLDMTSVTIIDINFCDLNTNLSKLIYIYLDFKLNYSIYNFDNTTLISDIQSVLENFYELYIIKTMFESIADKGS